MFRKVNDSHIDDLRKYYLEGYSITETAKKFGISNSQSRYRVVYSHGGDQRLKEECKKLARSFFHGLSKHPLNWIWNSMMQRCYNNNCGQYHNYGGRGIYVCEEWKIYKDFANWCFSNGWSKELQLDRVDNDKNYTPDNCRFVTCAENNQNRRNTKLSPEKVRQIRQEHDSRDCISSRKALAVKYGVHPNTIQKVVERKAWKNIK